MISQKLQKDAEDSDGRQHSMVISLYREIRIPDSQCFAEKPGRVAVYNMC